MQKDSQLIVIGDGQQNAEPWDEGRNRLNGSTPTRTVLLERAETELLWFAQNPKKGADQLLNDASLPLPERLVGAFDAVVGRFVGMFGAEAADLAEAGNSLVGNMIREHEGAFTEDVAKSLRSAGLVAAYKPAGLSARQLADTLFATARGLKYSCSSRSDFSERMSVAARALCAPLRKAQ